MVRAKFLCQSVGALVAQENVSMTPVVEGSAENRSFSKYTPGGKLELSITNEDLLGHFKPGKEYYVDITEAFISI